MIPSYACSPETAADEFTLLRETYLENTGRSRGDEIIAYHVRQAFKPGEISPEDANEIGKELARKMTSGSNAFVVATHTDRQHIHNHIIICATALDCQHKYRDVKQSSKDLVRLSDALCEKHGLSVIREPMRQTVSYDQWQGSQRRFTHRDDLRMIMDAALRMQPDGFDALMQLLEDAGCYIKRGAQISIKPPGGERYIRLDTLGPEYNEGSLRRTLSGDHVHIPKIPRSSFAKGQIKRLVDIEAKLRTGKGKGYQVWAERNNIDAKAQMVIFLKEHHIGSLEELNEHIHDLTDQEKELKAALREKQDRMNEINQQRQAIRDYRRTKEVYIQYGESGWSDHFYQDHQQEIDAHQDAQKVYASLGGEMPTLKELTAEYDELRNHKKELQAALGQLKPELTDLRRIRYNYDLLMRDALAGQKICRQNDREIR